MTADREKEWGMGESEPTRPTVLLVGHCAADAGVLRRWLRENFAAEVASCDAVDEALSLVRQGGVDLVLANRIFEFTSEEGLELIQHLQGSKLLGATQVLLISNFADAQAAATQAGAAPGFGKSDLHSPRAQAAVAAALASGRIRAN